MTSYIIIGIVVLAIIVFIMGRGGSSPAVQPQDVQLTDAQRQSVRSLMAGGQKIQAIKEVRAATGLGLKDSKACVEAIERGEI